MIVGTVELRLSVAGARNLKEKRRVISSLKDHIHNKFNVSGPLVAGVDLGQRAPVGGAQVSNDSRYLDSSLTTLVEMVKHFPATRLVDYSIEIA
jgi:uncharacterized protein YlxP (DUF503 family)